MSIQNLLKDNDYHIWANEMDTENINLTTINGAPYVGNVPALVPNKFLRTTNTVTPTMYWGDGSIPHGTSLQILHTNLGATGIEWTSSLEIPENLKVDGSTILNSNVLCDQTLTVTGDAFLNNNLTVDADFGVTNGSITVAIGDINGQTVNIDNQLKFGGLAGSNNQIIQSDGSGIPSWVSTIPSSTVSPGALNQVMVTQNVLPGPTLEAVWSNSLELPADLTVNGQSTTLNLQVNGFTTLVNAVSINGDLQFNNVSGPIGGFLKKTLANDQSFQTFALTDIPAGPNNRALFTRSGTTSWSSIGPSDITPGIDGQILQTVTGTPTWITPSTIRMIRYGTNFTAQDLNADAGPSFVSFSTSPFTNLASSSVGISQSSATDFTIGTTGTYDISLCGFIDPASTGISDSIITLSVQVNGAELTRTCVTSHLMCFSGTIPSVIVTAGSTVRIIRRRLAPFGSNTLVTYGPPATLPNYLSTVTFALVNTISP